MALLRRHDPTAPVPVEAPHTVRVLHDESELAAAEERAREGARRLQDRLDSRAAKDAWMAGLSTSVIGWQRLLRPDAAEADRGSSHPPAA